MMIAHTIQSIPETTRDQTSCDVKKLPRTWQCLNGMIDVQYFE